MVLEPDSGSDVRFRRNPVETAFVTRFFKLIVEEEEEEEEEEKDGVASNGVFSFVTPCSISKTIGAGAGAGTAAMSGLGSDISEEEHPRNEASLWERARE